MRYSLKWLIAAVMWFALAAVALRSGSVWWAATSLSITLTVLAVALTGSLLSSCSRPYWVGLTLFGCGYMFMVFGPGADRQIGSRIITTKLFAVLQPRISKAEPSRSEAWHGGSSSEFALHPNFSVDLSFISGGERVEVPAPQWEPFQQIGHSLFALPFAALGGAIGHYFGSRRGGEQ